MNAVLFHIVPVMVTRIFSPGVFTAVLLFLPSTVYIYYTAHLDGVLTTSGVLLSSVGGLTLMLFPSFSRKPRGNSMVRRYLVR